MKFSSIITAGCLAVTLSGSAQTVRFMGTVRAGETYRHLIGHGLVLIVTPAGIAVRRAQGAPDENFARCETLPAHGPNALDLDAWQLDPARDGGQSWPRREFQFALTASADSAECAELERALYRPDAPDTYTSHPMGRGLVTLSKVKLNASGDELESFQFQAVITLPRSRTLRHGGCASAGSR